MKVDIRFGEADIFTNYYYTDHPSRLSWARECIARPKDLSRRREWRYYALALRFFADAQE